jgi:hypothetical protein
VDLVADGYLKLSPMDDEDHRIALLSDRENINSSETPAAGECTGFWLDAWGRARATESVITRNNLCYFQTMRQKVLSLKVLGRPKKKQN